MVAAEVEEEDMVVEVEAAVDIADGKFLRIQYSALIYIS